MTRILAVSAAVFLLASCAQTELPTSEHFVDVGTHSLRAIVAGEGIPVVVFDGGIGAAGDEYAGLRDRVAAITTAVTYDRAGYGGSEPGPLPRDAAREASELAVLLRGLGLDGPYVLVGHSLGGLNAQVFAEANPEDVAGMVLLDPPPLSFILGEDYTELGGMAEQMTAEWQGIADRGAGAEGVAARSESEFFRMLASEHREMFGRSADLAAGIETFGDIPLVVVASGVPNPMFGAVAAAYQEYWVEESRKLAARSERGELVFEADSTHRLHEDAAETVERRIVSVVAVVRASE